MTTDDIAPKQHPAATTFSNTPDHISAIGKTPDQLAAYQQMLARAGASLDRLVARSQSLADHATRQPVRDETQATFAACQALMQQVCQYPYNVNVAERFAAQFKLLVKHMAIFRLAIIQADPASLDSPPLRL